MGRGYQHREPPRAAVATLLIRLTALPGQLRSQAAPFLRPLATQEPAALQAPFNFLQKPLQEEKGQGLATTRCEEGSVRSRKNNNTRHIVNTQVAMMPSSCPVTGACDGSGVQPWHKGDIQ